MDRARKRLRKYGGSNDGCYKDFGGDFYDLQAKLMGETLNMPAVKVKEMTERLIYRGWEPLFKKIRLFSHVRETLQTFQQKGIKLGLLSDFPPEIKLKNLGINDFWQVVLSSEQTGYLKPDPTPFLEMARRMGSPPEQILYVGNSVPYDIQGAHNAGMKAALIQPAWKKRSLSSPAGESAVRPDFAFYDYRQLCDYVIN